MEQANVERPGGARAEPSCDLEAEEVAGRRVEADFELCASHDMRATGAFIFCRRCGGHTTTRRSKVLREGCRGESNQTCHQRLRAGLHPVSGVSQGPVVKWPSVELDS